MSNDTAQIADHAERHRYELSLGGKLAGHIAYRTQGEGVIDFVHTEVDAAFEGQGLASKMAKFALDDARAKGLRVIATCEYIAAWIQKHPEYRELLAQS